MNTNACVFHSLGINLVAKMFYTTCEQDNKKMNATFLRLCELISPLTGTLVLLYLVMVHLFFE